MYAYGLQQEGEGGGGYERVFFWHFGVVVLKSRVCLRACVCGRGGSAPNGSYFRMRIGASLVLVPNREKGSAGASWVLFVDFCVMRLFCSR